MLDFNILQSSNSAQSFPDPALEARIVEECYVELRDSAQSEKEYMYWDSRVSEAQVEQQWWERDKK